ncbi:MAG TPA: hypothetical protein VM911_08770 [Pyrinomonadaceae bacterium]|jgi:uncharacterized repeat protein (TIGR01451 family)|nr:hypothetical protein [Pyrinomonadaceae bacterium]
MEKRERNVRLKGRAMMLASGFIVLACIAGLVASVSLAGQKNSNRVISKTIIRRAKKVSNNNQSNRGTNAGGAQNANTGSSNSGGGQARPAYQVAPPRSDVLLEKIMTLDGKELAPDVVEPIGAEITYKTFFTNKGNAPSRSLNIIDPIQDRTDFKLGSVVNELATTGLKVTVSYSRDGGENCDYTPVDGGGGAPPGFDRTVNAVCWSFSGDLGFTAPNNSGSVSYIGRRR